MRDPIAWFARHRVAANLLMVAIVAGGMLTLPTITREVFPDITPDLLTVRIPENEITESKVRHDKLTEFLQQVV